MHAHEMKKLVLKIIADREQSLARQALGHNDWSEIGRIANTAGRYNECGHLRTLITQAIEEHISGSD